MESSCQREVSLMKRTFPVKAVFFWRVCVFPSKRYCFSKVLTLYSGKITLLWTIGISQLICKSNKLVCFYSMTTLCCNGLKQNLYYHILMYYMLFNSYYILHLILIFTTPNCVRSVWIQNFFCFVFFPIRTEYGKKGSERLVCLDIVHAVQSEHNVFSGLNFLTLKINTKMYP